MVDYNPTVSAPAQVIPFEDLPAVTTPVTAGWLNHVHAVLADVAGDSARLEDLETAEAAHVAATTSVHGITNTAALETTTGSAAKVTAHAAATDPHGDRAFTTSAIATHEADTTAVHGITDTAALATTAAVAAGYQPLDADLTTIAGLTATSDNFIQAKSSAWASRTPAQVKTDLALSSSDVGLGNVANAAQVQLGTVDAKGDLLVGTADNTVARLAVGTNDYVLTADSGQSAGVKWAPASGGGGGVTASAKAYYSGGPDTANNASRTDITLNNVVYNNNLTALTSGGIRIPTGYGGLYLVTTTLYYIAGTAGPRSTLIMVNGSTRVEGGVATGGDTRPTAVWTLELADNDLVNLAIYASGGGDIQIFGASEKDISLALTKVG